MRRRSIYLILVGLLCNPFIGFSQDSIPAPSDIKEENFLKFQEHFFNALSQKSIYNYKIAIQDLEACNQLRPKNVAVFFELSKNYVLLKKYFEAEEYAIQALAIEPENYWILKHLSKLYRASSNIKKAIPIHEKIAEQNDKEREKLVYLYYQDNQLNKAKEILRDLENQDQLTPKLLKFKKIFVKTTVVKKRNSVEELSQLIKEFESHKSFESLYKILTLSTNTTILLAYSQIGLELYPAQAFVYLMNGRAQNQNRNFKKAIEQLTNGIDFVIDNSTLEADFYDEIATGYSGLGDEKLAIKNKNKALALRKK
jgi:tetratricopeptide (TPR) repeat protein